ncbi:hypothetical protein HH214_03345 [Mucilaginibacter robiniae]|uniref:Uncharacterized protein n=1 Tax=Mucilaginibacter robiniae TaxID=2728022 RepID=A0A7L5E2F8_9SPHI|nr:hypothetical protein [Mucilaginibacter robiniae]QJD94983.1 hypothetical protein HH214_03345 [Mucilaginibacter robiniae]
MKNLFIPAFILSFILFKTSVAQQSGSDETVKFVKPQKQIQQPSFKIKQITYQVPDADFSIGKTVNLETFKKEKERIYLLLYAIQPQIQPKDIRFNVDTTQQKHACSIVTIVKTSNN